MRTSEVEGPAMSYSYRQVFMDGRQHPAELDPTWWGHSIGRWDGDTLVIDTVGFNGKSWFDNKGHPHTERLHTIERWTRPGDELMEYICQENNQYGIAQGFKPAGN
jgi:hypothetical protein